MSLSIPTHHLSFSKTLSLSFPNPPFSLQIPQSLPRKTLIIRNGGGPRTYPGGVSKWQWKRMQAKKAKQLLKARLSRERQIYEMRKRAELKAAVSELERPWEVVERAPNLFSVSADEQVKVLADRFQKPGGFDMWTERDGPQLFETPSGVPSARFFPKGVVHSVKPYGRIGEGGEVNGLGLGSEDGIGNRELGVGNYGYDEISDFGLDSEKEVGNGELGIGNYGCKNDEYEEISDGEVGFGLESGKETGFGEFGIGNYGYNNDLFSVNGNYVSEREDGSDSESGYRETFARKPSLNTRGMKRNGGNWRKKEDRSKFGSGFREMDSRRVGSERKKGGMSALSNGDDSRIARSNIDGTARRRRGPKNSGPRNRGDYKSKVYDMSLQQNGTYGVPRR